MQAATRPLSIMQGRLLPPVNGKLQAFPGPEWQSEFELAARLGLVAIELIAEVRGQNLNPLFDESASRRLEAETVRTGVAARSVCGDLIIEDHQVHGRDGLRRLIEGLIGRCATIGACRLVIPLVDEARIQDGDDLLRVQRLLERAALRADQEEVELHLETDLKPATFATLLEPLPPQTVWVNYDTGNSAGLGYDPAEEFSAYGHRIGSIHVKDRLRGGGSVPLGSGHTQLATVFKLLAAKDYRGDLVLQPARGDPGAEIAWIRAAIEFVSGLQRIRGS